MKLLRYFSLALVVCTAAVGCIDNRDEYDSDYVISFVPAVKAMDGDLTGESALFPQDKTFGAWAFTLPEGQTWASSSSKATTYLEDALVSYSGGTWQTSDSKHWGKTGEQLTFFAYSPSFLPVEYDNARGITLSSYNTLTDDADILYSDAVTDVEKNIVLGRVSIPFNHALSKVVIYARACEEDVQIVLKSVKVGDVYYKGSFHSQPAGWDLTGDKTDLEFCTKDVTLGTEPVRLSNLDVLSQGESRPVTVTIDVYVEGVKTSEKTFTPKPITGKWGLGRQYTYTLDVTSTGVTYKTDILD